MEKPMVHTGEVEEKIGNRKSLQGAACHTFPEQVEVAWMLLVFTINVQTIKVIMCMWLISSKACTVHFQIFIYRFTELEKIIFFINTLLEILEFNLIHLTWLVWAKIFHLNIIKIGSNISSKGMFRTLKANKE